MFYHGGDMTGNLVLLAICILPIRADVPLAVAPAPHVPCSPVSFAAVKGGYRVSLNRATAEMLADALMNTDEKEVAASLRKIAKDKKEGASNPDDQTAATLEMIAFVVSSQLPGFKKAMSDNMGPQGVVITMTGLQADKIKFAKPRPRLERALETVRGVMPLLPEEAQEALEAMRAVGRTTPLFWKVEPRE
jgi:hypothetical protein